MVRFILFTLFILNAHFVFAEGGYENDEKIKLFTKAYKVCELRDGIHKVVFFWNKTFEVMCEDGTVHTNKGVVIHSWVR